MAEESGDSLRPEPLGLSAAETGHEPWGRKWRRLCPALVRRPAGGARTPGHRTNPNALWESDLWGVLNLIYAKFTQNLWDNTQNREG